jgi:hypothetical protein
MTLSDLITIMTNRLASLNGARGSAVSVGDLVQVAKLDAEIVETQQTLDQLRSLNG